jgi:membrane-associated phospholipid phosphatase
MIGAPITLRPLDRLFLVLNSLYACMYLLAVFRGASDAVSLVMLLVFILTMPAALLLVRASGGSSSACLSWLHCFYPQAMLTLYFTQSIRLSRLLHTGTFDGPVARLEEILFGGRPVLDLFYALPKHPVLNELFFFAYFSFYLFLTLPWWLLYFQGKKREAEESLFTIIAAFGFLYLWYILFPVEGPKLFYPELKALWYDHFSGGLFTLFMKNMFTPSTMAGAALPSSHVAIGLLALLLVRTFYRILGRIMLVLYILLVISTVYLYTHYLVDILAGLLYGSAAFLLVPRLTKASYRSAVEKGAT